jgi:ribosomal protein S18 acetylase RimI-like enzyme
MASIEIRTELVPPGPQLNTHRDELWRVLEWTDHDFVPPLSVRQHTTLGKLKPSRVAFDLPIEHLEFLLGLNVMFAYVNNRVVGFLSFLDDFRHETLPSDDPCVLIDTVAVVPAHRRHGVARALYRALFATAVFQAHDNAVLHTWSTNRPHGELIEALGFQVIKRIPNERGPGIDTLIYLRPTKPSPFDADDIPGKV